MANGYHSGTTIKALVREMERFVKQKILGWKNADKGSTTAESFEFVKRILTEMTIDDNYEIKDFYVIIHSMDMG